MLLLSVFGIIVLAADGGSAFTRKCPLGYAFGAITLVAVMYWTLELATHLEDAPWPATKDELIDYADRSGAPMEVIENLRAMEDDGEPYESIEEIWPDYPTADDDFYFEEE